MKRSLGRCRRWALLPGLLLLAAGPAGAQWSNPEVYQIDTWTVMVMDHSYLAIREPFTGSSGMDVLAGVRTKKDPGQLRFLDFDNSDALAALDSLSSSGFLWNTDVEKAKALLEERGFSSMGQGGGWSDLLEGELKTLEGDSGTSTIGPSYIAEAFKRLTTGNGKASVAAQVDDCTFLSGVLYFAEKFRQAQQDAGIEGSSEPLSSQALSVACQVAGTRPPGVPAGPGVFPAIPTTITPPFPITPAQPPVWAGENCSENEPVPQRACVDSTWKMCTCNCFADSQGYKWRPSGACVTIPPVTLPTPPAAGPTCKPPGGYIPCTPPTGSVCLCSPPPAGSPPGTPGNVTPIPPPAPPPTPAPTTPPSSGSAEVAILFFLLTAIAVYRLHRQRRA